MKLLQKRGEGMGAKETLINHNIRPSITRLEIMEYLLSVRTHPTVEEIYDYLLPKIPTLSKTTVYNTLKLFSEEGIIKLLTIDGAQVRADGFNDMHGHFLCTGCRKLFDFPLGEIARECLEGFDVKTREVLKQVYNAHSSSQPILLFVESFLYLHRFLRLLVPTGQLVILAKQYL